MNERDPRDHIQSSITFRLRIFSAIFLVLAVIVTVETVIAGSRAVFPVLACLVGGFAVGLVVSRMFKLDWDDEQAKVIGRIDVVGAVILVLYVLFQIFRARIVDLWLDGPIATAASLAVLAGVMAGQVVGTRQGVIRMFRIVAGRAGT